jgi:hypothetical protein
LCQDYDPWGRIDTTFYIKNFLTGEITYRFKDEIKLFASTEYFVYYDQYGAYIFLKKDGGLVLFDVEAKREYIHGEPLKRPSEYLFYAGERASLIGRYYGRKLLKHNIVTGEIEEVRLENLSEAEFRLSSEYDRRKFEYMGNNRLWLYSDFSIKILQLNESMTEVVSVTEREIEDSAGYIIPIDEGKYISFNGTPSPYPIDMVYYYSVQLLDEKGKVLKDYKDIVMVDDERIDKLGTDVISLLSRDKQYVLLFDTPISNEGKMSVYKIIYQTAGVLNDDRVRIRGLPGLSGEILGIVNRGDKVKILETGAEKQKIGDLESAWYRIRTEAGTEGWVFGAYVDVLDSE